MWRVRQDGYMGDLDGLNACIWRLVGWGVAGAVVEGRTAVVENPILSQPISQNGRPPYLEIAPTSPPYLEVLPDGRGGSGEKFSTEGGGYPQLFKGYPQNLGKNGRFPLDKRPFSCLNVTTKLKSRWNQEFL
jgi:hypothetical protein